MSEGERKRESFSILMKKRDAPMTQMLGEQKVSVIERMGLTTVTKRQQQKKMKYESEDPI